MTTQTTTIDLPGLTVRFYPERIDDDALASLSALAAEKLADRAPTFVAWLCQWIQDEQWRRLYADLSELGIECETPEADLPRIPFMQWTDSDVADALTAVTQLSYSISDPMAGEFIDRLTMAIVAIASHRLKKEGTR